MSNLSELISEFDLIVEAIGIAILKVQEDHVGWLICHHTHKAGGQLSIFKMEDDTSNTTQVNLSGDIIKQGLRTIEEIQPIIDALNAAEAKKDD